MDFPQPIPVLEIADMIGAVLIGDDKQSAVGINEIHKVRAGDITFVDIKKYYSKSLGSAASIIIINKECDCPAGKTLLLVDDPFEAYESLVRRYHSFRALTQSIAPSASIDPTAVIEPNVVIGDEVVIGSNCYIQSQCYIGSHTQIGNGVRIYAGSVIGTDAFYFKDRITHLEQWQSCGYVE
ncbi:MAG: UDP-3-O-(3-hydroxymyristoyl)glucosamine N-acyltransferase, partial [Saprospiraceae bacterium]|nr:UDP-3-O-(3-hydroxymyristoyl)glucosamine N-acyltransferase [Saprospiraceae bacterium]